MTLNRPLQIQRQRQIQRQLRPPKKSRRPLQIQRQRPIQRQLRPPKKSRRPLQVQRQRQIQGQLRPPKKKQAAATNSKTTSNSKTTAPRYGLPLLGWKDSGAVAAGTALLQRAGMPCPYGSAGLRLAPPAEITSSNVVHLPGEL